MRAENIKNDIKNNKSLLGGLFRAYSAVFSFGFRVNRENKLDLGKALLKRSKIRIDGVNNEIIVSDFARLVDCKIIIEGNNNKVYLGEEVKLYGADIKLFGDNNVFHMGQSTSTNGSVEFNVLDGCRMKIGEDCMFSRNINLWTGDFHSILNVAGERINQSKDVIIGNRVWVGTESNILKGTHIGDDSVIGAGSIVSKKFDNTHAVIAGNPAKVMKKDISWDRKNL